MLARAVEAAQGPRLDVVNVRGRRGDFRALGAQLPELGLARKEKALAEAAALLVLKKTVESTRPDEADDTDERNES
jgi:hypothetical protein